MSRDVATQSSAPPTAALAARARGQRALGVCVRNAVKRFPGVSAANGVSFELPKGQLMALLGPSGCGKTTTLRLIAGFERLDAGEIEIGGQLVAGPGLHLPPERRRVGMVFQEYALFPHLSVAENVRFGLHQYQGDKARRVAQVLEMVGLAGYQGRMPHELSGGQQQRVALARALAPEPELILLDEPFSNLDAGLRVRVRAEVRNILRQANATAIFVTHDQEEALSLVDVVAVLIDGVVRQVAPPQKLYRQPADLQVAAFLGDANFLPGVAHGRRVECELGTLEAINDLTGSVDVLVRPENITIMPAAADSPNRVRHILFFGHDQLVSIQLASGRVVDARMGPMYHFAVGQPVQVRVEGPVMTYAARS
ncbi:MAG TPA: ABC transporter ATP-binding protein [Caldilineaceae bacterium]|nr:ABC transporter ATP-binding protein [Caldilineaceae bacterium]